MKQLLPFLITIIFSLLLGLSQKVYAAQPYLNITSNVTNIDIGEYVSVSCELVHFEPQNESFEVSFYRGYPELIASYKISLNSTPNTTFTLNPTHFREITVTSHGSSLNLYTISLIGKQTDAHPYYCTLKSENGPVITSEKMYIYIHKPKPKVTVLFITNVTSIHIGRPFRANCSIINLDILSVSDPFSVWFYRSLQPIGFFENKYHLPYPFWKTSFHATKETVDFSPPKKFRNMTNYEILITPRTITHGTEFWCAFDFAVKDPILSNRWSPTVEADTLSFALNVSKPESGRPFTASCFLDKVTVSLGPYSVDFIAGNSALLGSYKVSPQSSLNTERHATLIHEELDNLTVHHGAHFNYPIFELIIIETGNLGQEFWCQYSDSETDDILLSNHWPMNAPKVTFSLNSTRNPVISTVCEVDHFEAEGNTYNVKFFTSLGPDSKGANELAIYEAKPNEPPEFTIKHNSNFKVTAGRLLEFPQFEIDFTRKSKTTKAKFWCTLGVGLEGQAAYKEIKSNVLEL